MQSRKNSNNCAGKKSEKTRLHLKARISRNLVQKIHQIMKKLFGDLLLRRL